MRSFLSTNSSICNCKLTIFVERTYPSIYNHSWIFLIRIRYMRALFLGPYLSHIRRSTCTFIDHNRWFSWTTFLGKENLNQNILSVTHLRKRLNSISVHGVMANASHFILRLKQFGLHTAKTPLCFEHAILCARFLLNLSFIKIY